MNVSCETERDLVYHPAFQVMMTLCMASTVGSYIFMAVFFRKYAFRLYWHLNIKILFYYNFVICFALGTAILINFIGMWRRIAVAKSNCEVIPELRDCAVIRWVFLVAFCLITLNHTAIVFERLWATIRLSKYEKSSGILGIILVILITCASFLIVYYIMIPEDPTELVPTCLSLSASKIGPNIYFLFYFQCLLEVLVLTLHKSLLWFNRRRSRRSGHADENLSEKFQINENVAVLEQMNPLIITCTLVIGGYNIVAIAIRPFRYLLTKNQYIIIAFAVFVIPYLPFILTSIAYHMLKKQLKERAELAKQSVEQDIIKNAQFSNNYYNWDSSYFAKYSNTSNVPATKWWHRIFKNQIQDVK